MTSINNNLEPTMGEWLITATVCSPPIAAAGYIIGSLGALFTSMHPLVGGAFGATTLLVMAFTGPIFFKLFESEKHPNISCALSWTSTLITSAVISKAILSMAGLSFPAFKMSAVFAVTLFGLPWFVIIAGHIGAFILAASSLALFLLKNHNKLAQQGQQAQVTN